MVLQLQFYFNRGFLALIVMFFLLPAQAKILFEGYYKLLASDKHAGYVVQRYEHNPKAKQFISTYFIKTGPLANNITESLKAICNDKFEPVSYQYTSKVGKKIKTIDAKFHIDKKTKKVQMDASVTENGKQQKLQQTFEKGTFLSTFLGYIMLKKGYEKGRKYNYVAVAEEDAKPYKGEAYIKETQVYTGIEVFRILNKFKNVKFISYVNPSGEVIATNSPVQRVAMQLSASAKLAAFNFAIPEKTLGLLFGNVPAGLENAYAKMAAKKSKALSPFPNEKQLTPPPKSRSAKGK